MAVYLQAPWDLIQTTIMLPDPNLGDLKNNEVEVNIRNSIDGEIYSYIKTGKRIKLSYDFILKRFKSLELEEFNDFYGHLELRYTDWNERVYRVYIRNNPLDFTRIGRNQRTVVRLELEGERIS